MDMNNLTIQLSPSNSQSMDLWQNYVGYINNMSADIITQVLSGQSDIDIETIADHVEFAKKNLEHYNCSMKYTEDLMPYIKFNTAEDMAYFVLKFSP